MPTIEVDHGNGVIMEVEIPDDVDPKQFMVNNGKALREAAENFDPDAPDFSETMPPRSQDYWDVLHGIEGTGSTDLTLKNKAGSSATGPFQILKPNWKKYGLTEKSTYADHERASRDIDYDNYKHMKKRLGREPSDAEMYFAYQQGSGGASAMIRNPDKTAFDVLSQVYGSSRMARKAIEQNLPKNKRSQWSTITGAEFRDHWLGTYERRLTNLQQAKQQKENTDVASQ